MTTKKSLMQGVELHSLHGGGFVRKLTAKDKAQQKKNLKAMQKENNAGQNRLMGKLV